MTVPPQHKAHVVSVAPVLGAAGAERVLAELAKRVRSRGFETSVICLEDERAPIGVELSGTGIPVAGLRIHRRRSLASAWALSRHLPDARPLIVHSHLFHANLAARLAVRFLPAARRRDVWVVGTAHVAERRFRPWQFLLDRLTAHWSVAEVCVSEDVARFQQARTGLPEAFFPVIENGIDIDRFTPAPRAARPVGDFRVVSLGRLDIQKDYPTLLRAWRIVSGALPRAKLTIAGEGPQRSQLQSLCASLQLSNVEFAGFVQEVPAFLRGADLYVQSSAWEGFGLAVAEAMCSALPVIVTDTDGLRHTVRHGSTGWVVPKRQPEALAEAIGSLLNDPVRSAALGEAARREAVQRFAVERMVNDYARLYDAVVSGSAGDLRRA